MQHPGNNLLVTKKIDRTDLTIRARSHHRRDINLRENCTQIKIHQRPGVGRARLVAGGGQGRHMAASSCAARAYGAASAAAKVLVHFTHHRH